MTIEFTIHVVPKQQRHALTICASISMKPPLNDRPDAFSRYF